ncbi:MAG: Rpn family recombination-promoting nuclease/putative transposase [Lachnospiraceae bacterium]|nr:Rpn family recombination-promoting nuclease/putative transposase [Lachnospiraceae bacterium]
MIDSMKKNSADGFQIFETKRGGQKIWENQTEIHTAMPLRSLLYDTLRYTKQAEDVAAEYRQQRKEGHSPKMTKAEFLSGWKYTDKLEPVITLVIYYGTDEWDGAKSLHDMFSEDVDEKILECVPDYKINLIEPNKIEDFDKFQTDFGKLLEAIRYKDDETELTKIFTGMTAIDKLIADAISYYVDERCSKMVEPVEGGKVGMRSKALDMIEERGIVKGMSQGRTAGMVENAIITVKNLIRDFDFSLEQACSAANISVEDYKKNTEK